MSLKVAKELKFPDLNESNQGTWDDSFLFIQAADTQFGLIDNWAGNPESTRIWTEEIRLTKLAIRKANELSPKPKFFIVCGDLVDAFPGNIHKRDQIKDLKEVFQEIQLDIPLICVCGNHDVGNSPTSESLKNYRSDFGDDYFTFWVGGVYFIVINSQFYEDASNVPTEDQLHTEWLDNQLATIKTNKCTQAVIFQHIPWFITDPYEENQYFNINKEKRLEMLSKFHEAGIRYIFCGHYHRNAGGKFKDLELITTSAIGCQLGEDKSGIRIVKVTKNNIEHKYYGLDDTFPANIDLKEKLP